MVITFQFDIFLFTNAFLPPFSSFSIIEFAISYWTKNCCHFLPKYAMSRNPTIITQMLRKIVSGQFILISFLYFPNLPLKSSTILINPSLNPTFGDHPSNFSAFSSDGLRFKASPGGI